MSSATQEINLVNNIERVVSEHDRLFPWRGKLRSLFAVSVVNHMRLPDDWYLPSVHSTRCRSSRWEPVYSYRETYVSLWQVKKTTVFMFPVHNVWFQYVKSRRAFVSLFRILRKMNGIVF